ncbi:MAG TPA: hypothetical protein P5539_09915 [Mesotoga sp.]|nr:hypothetical protein [Mesotoga sp.]
MKSFSVIPERVNFRMLSATIKIDGDLVDIPLAYLPDIPNEFDCKKLFVMVIQGDDSSLVGIPYFKMNKAIERDKEQRYVHPSVPRM